MDDFVEVYATATGRKQLVPRGWLADPVLSVGIRKTPSQRELDGELPQRPTQDSTVKEIDQYAKQAGIDLSGLSKHDEKLTAVEAVHVHSDVQEGMAAVDPDVRPPDPLSPPLVAQSDEPAAPLTPADALSAEPSDETPAPGDEEN